MRWLTTRALIAALTFIVGVAATYVWMVRRNSLTPATGTTVQPPTQVPSSHLSQSGNDLLIKTDGWEMPNVAKLRPVSRKRWRPDESPVNVYRTDYETGSNLLMPLKRWDGSSDPVRRQRVDSLSVFDIGGRQFCYRMLVWDVPLKGEAGVGAKIWHTFYDLDGDGRFESWAVRDDIYNHLRMPRWAQQ